MANHDRDPAQVEGAEGTLSGLRDRFLRFRHVAPIVREDLPELWRIADQIDEGRLVTTLVARHRANPGGIGPSTRYDVWQQNPRFGYPQIYIYEPDNHGTSDAPDVVIRDFPTSAAATDQSWQIKIWSDEQGARRPQGLISEFTPGILTQADIGALSIGIRRAIQEVER